MQQNTRVSSLLIRQILPQDSINTRLFLKVLISLLGLGSIKDPDEPLWCNYRFYAIHQGHLIAKMLKKSNSKFY